MTPHGAFHWNELNTRDKKKAKAFYKKTLGWTYDEVPMGPGRKYTIVKSGDKQIGGIFEMDDSPMFKGLPEHWFAYIAVDNVDKRVKKLAAAGGKVIREPYDVPTVGRIAIVQDDSGAMQGWMVPAPDGQ